jgi:hypothetical protein
MSEDIPEGIRRLLDRESGKGDEPMQWIGVSPTATQRQWLHENLPVAWEYVQQRREKG